MGSISLKKLLPKERRNPDDARPIGSLNLPKTARVTPAGFDRKPGDPLVFQKEIEVNFRLVEREWSYQSGGISSLQTERTWRVEFAVEKGGPIGPGHFLVVAQEPYGNQWVEHVPFHRYSKKPESERALPALPNEALDRDKVAWLDRHVTHDPWETGTRLVAGISHPHGFGLDEPRNSAGDLVLGVCPDFEEITREIMASAEIQKLIATTLDGTIVFWYPGIGEEPPALHQDVKDDVYSLMWVSVRQALAGPRSKCEEWVGAPVSKWVGCIYRDHLNARNKSVYQQLAARKAHENENLHTEKDRIDRIGRYLTADHSNAGGTLRESTSDSSRKAPDPEASGNSVNNPAS